MKILIVDDEQHIRESVFLTLSNNGYTNLLTAENGVEALEIIQKFHPDIVIADIRMPGMDGITLISEVNQIYDDVIFIFISGYDLFEYAQKALQYCAFSYLLKPIKDTELLAITLQAVEKLQKKRILKDNNTILKINAAQGTKLLNKQFILELISDSKVDEKYIDKKLKELNMCFKDKLFLFLIFSIDDYNSLTNNISNNDKELLKFSVENVVTEILDNFELCHFELTYEDGHGVLINFSESSLINNFEDLQNICKEMQKCIETYLKFTVTIGIGQTINSIEKLHLSFNSAIKAIMQRLTKGNCRVCHLHENPVPTAQSGIVNFKIEQDLLSCFEKYDKAAVIYIIESLYFKISNNEFVNTGDLMKLNFQLILSIYKIMNQSGVNLENILGDELLLYNEVNTLQSLEMIKRWFYEKLDLCFDILSKRRENGNKKEMENAREFIKNNYNKEINLDAVAEHVYLSPGYFSKQFKAEFNETFIDYLINFRINKAKELLKEGRYKANEISTLVGFSDEKYFFKVFKKVVGQTPKEYKLS